MPAYSFKEMFVPMVVEGSKRQTIRARRKHPPRKGQVAYNYFGMRTKFCKKLIEATIRDVCGVYIDANNIILYSRVLENSEIEIAKVNPYAPGLPDSSILSKDLMNKFAWKDGFRPEGNCEYNEGSFDLMLHFWGQTHSLPFVGDVIYW